jgi:hypothetical protein
LVNSRLKADTLKDGLFWRAILFLIRTIRITVRKHSRLCRKHAITRLKRLPNNARQWRLESVVNTYEHQLTVMNTSNVKSSIQLACASPLLPARHSAARRWGEEE